MGPGKENANTSVAVRYLRPTVAIFFGAVVAVAGCLVASAAESKWEEVKAAAKKEGKLVMGIPPSAELRTSLESVMRKRFGVELETVPGNPSVIARRIAEEYRAGVRYFDLFIGTGNTVSASLRSLGAVDPLAPQWVLPEVADASRWWGGHIWSDRDRRYVYAHGIYVVYDTWYNTRLVNPAEVRSHEDLLNPKWKGKIGFVDPRLTGIGSGSWTAIYLAKGEGYLRKLVRQDLVINRDRRTVADWLARGRLAISIGSTYYNFAPFIKASLPVKPLPPFKEGMFITSGQGGTVLIKNRPHPSAATVFVNWFLSREGQELHSKVMSHPTRRLDVDTRGMTQYGVQGAKDFLTLDEMYKYEIFSEERVDEIRGRAMKVADELLP